MHSKIELDVCHLFNLTSKPTIWPDCPKNFLQSGNILSKKY